MFILAPGNNRKSGRGRAVAQAAVALAVLAAAAGALDADDKRALAEKQGDEAKRERAAALEVMQSFEAVSPAFAVAVASCRAVRPAPPKEEKKATVNVGGEGWASLAGALINAAGSQPSRDEGGDGRVLVTMDVKIKNTNGRTALVGPGDFTLSTPEGYTVAHSVRTYNAPQPLAALYLPAGATTGGTLVFALEPSDEYTLNYYNAETAAAGAKKVYVMTAD